MSWRANHWPIVAMQRRWLPGRFAIHEGEPWSDGMFWSDGYGWFVIAKSLIFARHVPVIWHRLVVGR